MNIKILDSWLRDYVKTSATPQQIAEKLSLASVSVERIEPYQDDFVYDIEVTTNRPDLMSVIGIARETAIVLKENGIDATFAPRKTLPNPPLSGREKNLPLTRGKEGVSLTINNDPRLVNRLCAVVMDVTAKESPQKIKDRLNTTDIRSLNNLIDITNYVMRVTGHPTHVFDYDRLHTKTLTIRESKPKEKITTLDKKTYTLPGGDIVAVNDAGETVDLLGVMGLENSVVTEETKRIVFFINNNEPYHIRKTSMTLGIRTEAAVLNEKELDPELAYEALLYGIQLYQELADGKVISPLMDIYPNKVKPKPVTVSEEHINKVIGVHIPLKKSAEILEGLGFEVIANQTELTVTPPTFRAKDIALPEDVIEEIARIYGYHNIPNTLPASVADEPYNLSHNTFFWEEKIKEAMKYWGFTEVYTYPMVSEAVYDGDIKDAITLQNPLSEDFVYMRRTLLPSLLKVTRENKKYEKVHIFEIANVYQKKGNDLPEQIMKFAGTIKKPRASFYEVKGLIEQLLEDLGVQHVLFTPDHTGAVLSLKKHSLSHPDNHDYLGAITLYGEQTVGFELDFETICAHATLKKTYRPVSKYPPIIEDLALIAPVHVQTGDIIRLIKKQSTLITDVSLLDKYQDTRTFHVVYQSHERNLTDEEVGNIRTKILHELKIKYGATLKQ